jgi:hypothetical protein
MGKTVVVLIAAGLGGLFYYQRHQSPPSDQPEKSVASVRVAEAAKPPLQARAQPSEHDWMKRALDRASDVAHQSRERIKQNQDP